VNETQGLLVDPAIGEIEKEGIRRAKIKASQSDVIIALAYCKPASGSIKERHEPEIVIDELSMTTAMNARHSLIVVNKVDSDIYGNKYSELPENWRRKLYMVQKRAGVAKSTDADLPAALMISCKDAQLGKAVTSESGAGNIRLLVDKLATIFEEMTNLPTDMEDLLGVTERQRQLLVACAKHLNLFINEARTGNGECDIVLAAEHLRSAANCLSRIIGRGEASDIEEVLGVVFEKYFISLCLVNTLLTIIRFCVGK
jgi:tRNA modification GTPase